MPHLRFRSFSAEQVQKLSASMPAPLAECMETTSDNFTFELIGTQYFQSGKAAMADPMIEVLWFDRGQATQDKAALKITELAQQVVASDYLAVVFIALPKTAYYENGKHF